MTIEQMGFFVEKEKYLKGLSLWQVNKGNQGALQTQTETRVFWVMERVPKGVLADAVEVDHLSATTTRSLGTWPTSVRTQWCHVVMGNSSHPLQPEGSLYVC